MKQQLFALAVVTLILGPVSNAWSQSVSPGVVQQAPPSLPESSGSMNGHRWTLFARFRGTSAPAGTPRGSGTNPAGTTGLPRGRRYYNGRYFGSFNNRFYSPQYGYF
jgi:hypothetical protein